MNKLKQTIADSGGFRHWFANVFWYHYKWPVIVAVIVLTVLIYTTVDALRTPRYDAKLAVITTRTMTDEQFDEVRDTLAAALGDVNGDGRENILIRLANLSDGEYADEYKEVFFTCLSDEDYVIYLMDGDTSAVYTSAAMGYFDELADYGIASDPDNPCRRSLADCALIQRAAAEDLYLCILNHGAGSADEAAQARTEQALTLVHALLGDQEAGTN